MFREDPLNKAALFIQDELTEEERKMVFSSISEMIETTHFHYSFYRTIGEDFIEFLLKFPEEYYSRFTFHMISSVDYFDESIINAINYMENFGLTIKNHHFPVGFDHIASNQSYNKFIHRIINEADETISFYKRDGIQTSKMVRPIDVAKRMQKKAFIHFLDGNKKLTLA